MSDPTISPIRIKKLHFAILELYISACVSKIIQHVIFYPALMNNYCEN